MPQTIPLSGHCVLQATSPDELQQAYRSINTPISVTPADRSQPFACIINAVDLGPLQLAAHWAQADLVASTESVEDSYALTVPLAAGGEITHGHTRVPVIAGVSGSLSSPGFGVTSRLPSGHIALEIVARRATLDEALTALTGLKARSTVRFAPAIALADGPGGALARLMAFIAAEVDHDAALLSARHVTTRYAELLLFNMLSHLPHSHSQQLRDIHFAEAPYVRRALEYIEAHAAEDVTLAQIAQASGIGVRALQLGFRKARGCSPMEFLRARRLEMARVRLLAGAASVTEVAYACNFWHLGRFSASYRDRYGEHPTETLRRRGRGAHLS